MSFKIQTIQRIHSMKAKEWDAPLIYRGREFCGSDVVYSQCVSQAKTI